MWARLGTPETTFQGQPLRGPRQTITFALDSKLPAHKKAIEDLQGIERNLIEQYFQETGDDPESVPRDVFLKKESAAGDKKVKTGRLLLRMSRTISGVTNAGKAWGPFAVPVFDSKNTPLARDAAGIKFLDSIGNGSEMQASVELETYKVGSRIGVKAVPQAFRLVRYLRYEKSSNPVEDFTDTVEGGFSIGDAWLDQAEGEDTDGTRQANPGNGDY